VIGTGVYYLRQQAAQAKLPHPARWRTATHSGDRFMSTSNLMPAGAATQLLQLARRHTSAPD
jgi:hypothetical protein